MSTPAASKNVGARSIGSTNEVRYDTILGNGLVPFDGQRDTDHVVVEFGYPSGREIRGRQSLRRSCYRSHPPLPAKRCGLADLSPSAAVPVVIEDVFADDLRVRIEGRHFDVLGAFMPE